MKKQNNKYYEYIDQFRKISILQKLPTLNDRLQNIFEDEDKQKDTNNFMRLRKEPVIATWDHILDDDVVLTNECVQEKVDNLLEVENREYEVEDGQVRQQISMYKKWSENNKDLHTKKQYFKFFYRNASPPVKMSDSQAVQKQQRSLNEKRLNDLQLKTQSQKSELDFLNIGSQKSKYDFKLINQKRLNQNLDKSEKQLQQANNTEKEEDLFVHSLRKFQKFKTLEDIQAMDEVKIVQQSFFYDLTSNDEDLLNLDRYFLNKFIYKSVTKSLKDTQKDVQYFRDIGLPSRNLDKYSQTISDTQAQSEHLEQQTKQQAHYLHLLRENQLNINKNQLTYDDVSNLCNGRVTALNAYMCIRQEKVTKAQLEKLLKKLDRYKKQEIEKGKQRHDVEVMKEDFDLEENVSERMAARNQKNSIMELVSEIGEIRQSTVLMKSHKQNPSFGLRDQTFQKQKFTRMQALLKKLYEKIVVNPVKYHFTYLEDNLQNIQEMLQEPYKDGKLLWFILDCYEEVMKNLPDEDNIKSILKKKPINGPKVTHYKGGKLLKEEDLKAVHLFTYRDKNKGPAQVPTNDKSKGKTKTNANNTSMRSGVSSRPSRSPVAKTGQRQTTPIKTVQKPPFYTKANLNRTIFGD